MVWQYTIILPMDPFFVLPPPPLSHPKKTVLNQIIHCKTFSKPNDIGGILCDILFGTEKHTATNQPTRPTNDISFWLQNFFFFFFSVCFFTLFFLRFFEFIGNGILNQPELNCKINMNWVWICISVSGPCVSATLCLCLSLFSFGLVWKIFC